MILLAMMSLMGSASAKVVGGMLPVQGGAAASDGRYSIVCGPPMYDYFTGCQITWLEITNPLNGSTLYWSPPSLSVNLTVSTSAANPTLCQYKLNSGGWNNFTHCGGGINATWEDIVTLPEGYPVVITVSICGTTNTSDVKVYGRAQGFSYIDDYTMFILGVGLVGVAAMTAFMLRKRRKHRKNRRRRY